MLLSAVSQEIVAKRRQYNIVHYETELSLFRLQQFVSLPQTSKPIQVSLRYILLHPKSL